MAALGRACCCEWSLKCGGIRRVEGTCICGSVSGRDGVLICDGKLVCDDIAACGLDTDTPGVVELDGGTVGGGA